MPTSSPREQALHLRLKQLVASLPQVKSAWIFDARGHALVNSLVVPAPEIDFSDRDYFKVHIAGNVGTQIGAALQHISKTTTPGSAASPAASSRPQNPLCMRRLYLRTSV